MNILLLDEQYLVNHIGRSPAAVLCRSCLSECVDGVCLFAEQSILDGMFSVEPAEILLSCFGVIVNKHDNLPQLLCPACLTLAKSTYILKKQCENAEKILKRIQIKNFGIMRTPSRISTKNRQEAIEDIPNNIICNVDHKRKIQTERSLNSKKEILCSELVSERESSILSECSNFLKNVTNVKSVRRNIIINNESADCNVLRKRTKPSCSKNTDIFSESISRFTTASQVVSRRVKRQWSSAETLKSVNSKKMLGRGYKMLELALGRDMIVDEPNHRVKTKQRYQNNYDENRIKSYLKDVWQSRHKHRQTDSSPLSGRSLCSFELMTPPKHYFYQNITDVTNLGFTTPVKQMNKNI